MLGVPGPMTAGSAHLWRTPRARTLPQRPRSRLPPRPRAPRAARARPGGSPSPAGAWWEPPHFRLPRRVTAAGQSRHAPRLGCGAGDGTERETWRVASRGRREPLLPLGPLTPAASLRGAQRLPRPSRAPRPGRGRAPEGGRAPGLSVRAGKGFQTCTAVTATASHASKLRCRNPKLSKEKKVSPWADPGVLGAGGRGASEGPVRALLWR